MKSVIIFGIIVLLIAGVMFTQNKASCAIKSVLEDRALLRQRVLWEKLTEIPFNVAVIIFSATYSVICKSPLTMFAHTSIASKLMGLNKSTYHRRRSILYPTSNQLLSLAFSSTPDNLSMTSTYNFALQSQSHPNCAPSYKPRDRLCCL